MFEYCTGLNNIENNILARSIKHNKNDHNSTIYFYYFIVLVLFKKFGPIFVYLPSGFLEFRDNIAVSHIICMFIFKDATTTNNTEVFIYSPHNRNVREMCFHPANNDLVSCGADGTLRRADFDTCVFDEVSYTFFTDKNSVVIWYNIK